MVTVGALQPRHLLVEVGHHLALLLVRLRQLALAHLYLAQYLLLRGQLCGETFQGVAVLARSRDAVLELTGLRVELVAQRLLLFAVLHQQGGQFLDAAALRVEAVTHGGFHLVLELLLLCLEPAQFLAELGEAGQRILHVRLYL